MTYYVNKRILLRNFSLSPKSFYTVFLHYIINIILVESLCKYWNEGDTNWNPYLLFYYYYININELKYFPNIFLFPFLKNLYCFHFIFFKSSRWCIFYHCEKNLLQWKTVEILTQKCQNLKVLFSTKWLKITKKQSLSLILNT